MYIEPLLDEPCAIFRGVFQEPYCDGWCAVLEVGEEVFDLGRFGSFAAAGEAYLKAKHLLEGIA